VKALECVVKSHHFYTLIGGGRHVLVRTATIDSSPTARGDNDARVKLAGAAEGSRQQMPISSLLLLLLTVSSVVVQPVPAAAAAAAVVAGTTLSSALPEYDVLVHPSGATTTTPPRAREHSAAGVPGYQQPAVLLTSSLLSARDAARRLKPPVTIGLLPGVHRIDETLELGPQDSGVHWHSVDLSRPAIISGGTRVTGWKPHPTAQGTLVAPLPTSIPKGSTLRQLWVGGKSAERTVQYIPGNLTNTTAGFDFTHAGIDPSKWANPDDCEFVFHVKWWTQSRCTVNHVFGHQVVLKQPCILDVTAYQGMRAPYNKLCDVHGGYPIPGTRCGVAYIENVLGNLSQPGQFYYDKAGAEILYIPRAGESIAMVESTATTSVREVLVNISRTEHSTFKGIQYQHATWLAPSTNDGFVESQAGFSQNYNDCNSSQACRAYANGGGCGNSTTYLASCVPRRGREPLGAVRVHGGRSIGFENCSFTQLVHTRSQS
jgi:hypothetical protein